MKLLKRIVGVADRWQRHNRVVGPAYGVVKKFGDDQANLFVVSLGWYGFTAIYPLLLVVVTVLGYVGVASLGRGIVHTLHEFPVIGANFNPAPGSARVHGNPLALVIGLAGLLYGAQGVTQVAQQAMARVWEVPQSKLPGLLPRLGRSLLALATIGGSFLLTAFVGSFAVGHGHGLWFRALLILGLFVCNVALYLASFAALTPAATARARELLPGAVLGGAAFTLLTTLGTGLVEHQLRNTTATYGALASIIGVVAYLLLVAQLSIYAAELNPVLARRLWPRALPMGAPTAVDERARRRLAQTDLQGESQEKARDLHDESQGEAQDPRARGVSA